MSANTGAGKRCVLLLSGGLDSTTLLALAKRDGWNVYALTMRYGQRHEQEIEAARRVAARYDVADHIVAEINLRVFGGSSLTSDLPVPKRRLESGKDSPEKRDEGTAARQMDIPSTYVPARNTIFLSYALAFAETVRASDIFIGVNALDYSGYPDCRPEYIRAFETMANLATREGVEGRAQYHVHTPLIDMTKRGIVGLGISLGVDYSATMSCYDPAADGRACGACDACVLRRKGFAEAGVHDPTRYASKAR